MAANSRTVKAEINGELTEFRFGDKQLRAYRDGENLWFVANDVCDILELENSRQFLNQLDPDEKGVSKIYTPGGPQKTNLLAESGLYLAAMRSNKPVARKFTRWVTKEVLPQIRRTGRYTNSTEEDDRAVFAKISQAVRRMGPHARAVIEHVVLLEQELSCMRHHLTQVAEICENAVESDLRLHGLPQNRDISSPILGTVYNHVDQILEGLKRTATLRTGMFKDEETFQLFCDLVLKRSGLRSDLESDDDAKPSDNEWPPTSPRLQ